MASVARSLLRTAPKIPFSHFSKSATRSFVCMTIQKRVPSATPSCLPPKSSYSSEKKNTVTLHFSMRSGEKVTTSAKIGDSLLDVVVNNDIDIDGYGACDGTLACSTCHLIFTQADYDNIGADPVEEELDMLDLAYGLTDTSRLGCQVIVGKHMDGWTIEVPKSVADARDV